MSGGFEPLPLRLRDSDPKVFWSAEQHARCCSSLSAMASTTPVIKAIITHTSTTSTVTYERSMLPDPLTLTRVGSFEVEVTVPTGGADTYGKVGGFRVSGAALTIEGATGLVGQVRTIFSEVTNTILIRARLYDATEQTAWVGTLKIW